MKKKNRIKLTVRKKKRKKHKLEKKKRHTHNKGAVAEEMTMWQPPDSETDLRNTIFIYFAVINTKLIQTNYGYNGIHSVQIKMKHNLHQRPSIYFQNTIEKIIS